MAKTFPPKVVRPLILYLKDDKKSLHSCLFVFRDWCREAVYLLWGQTFHFLYTCNKTNLVSSRSTNPKDDYFYVLMDKFNELNFPETKQCFANLTELVFTADERKDEIFSFLSQTCHIII
ncbi:hypothetical protein C1645_871861 [Glomus cerebriforme]|uniref:Uncharacterized protein n=1 Tax=Glomus cerebriforme TaxID=658196 RepID=A0A397TP06_9GLOM|nr:hypothetical protein C1645_871861 [Glomus cerebriforme]